MKKILVIQTAFLGDVILATPVISELSRIFPDTTLDVLVRKGNESLLRNNPHISHTYTFDKKEGKIKNMWQLIKTFRNNQYDLIINLHRFGSSGIIAGLSKKKLVYGFSKNPFSFLYSKRFKHEIGSGKHEVERNLSIIKEFGAVEIKKPELFPSDSDSEYVKQYQGLPYFCFAPASVWFTKQLPKDKWIKLIKTCSKQGNVYLLGGPNDFDLCQEILSKANCDNSLNLAGKLNLLQSAALMKLAKRNFVNDSGPLHIASATNAPVTAFFCSTTPSFGFGPLSDDSKVNELNSVLACRPCGLHGHKECPEGHFRCGNEIELDYI